VLSIVLTNSQLALQQASSLPGDTGSKLQKLFQDMAITADSAGKLIHQFQKFVDSIEGECSQEENPAQIADGLRELLRSEPQVLDIQLEEKDSTAVSPIGPVSILIVDDEEKIRHALSYALTLSGHHVITASDGEEALDLLQSGFYNVAFVDLKMPGMDGWELAGSINLMSPITMIVLMTGWNVRLDDERLRKSHIDAVLAKPFQLSEVSNLIRVVTKQR